MQLWQVLVSVAILIILNHFRVVALLAVDDLQSTRSVRGLELVSTCGRIVRMAGLVGISTFAEAGAVAMPSEKPTWISLGEAVGATTRSAFVWYRDAKFPV